MRRVLAAASALVLMSSLLFTPVSAADDPAGKTVWSADELEYAVQQQDIRTLLTCFFDRNRDYYLENGLKPDFVFFNADRYLKANPDAGSSPAEALEHYLATGALEGRASCTDFDPVIAITVMPKGGLLTAPELLSSWEQIMGKASTKDYLLSVIPDAKLVYRYVAVRKTYVPADSSPAAGSPAVSTSAGTAPSAPQSSQQKAPSYTLMVYLCGTDLESMEGRREATRALLKVVLGAYDEENVNVLVLAGGTDTWKNEYFNDLLSGTPGEHNKSAIFTVNKEAVKAAADRLIADWDNVSSITDLYNLAKDDSKLADPDEIANRFINAETLPLYGSVSTARMGDVSTLVSLLEAAKSEPYRADQYGLSLWNHGGGSIEGICFPDDKTGPLEIPEIKAALAQADFGSTVSSCENKLGLLAFDACLMAGAETAAYLSDCYDMMYASEETAYGDIDYFNIINIANQRAGDDYLSYYLAIAILEDRLTNYKGLEDRLATGALFESGGTADSLAKLNTVARDLNELAAADKTDAQTIYRAFKNARLRCEQIGSEGAITSCKDYVDMLNFLQMLKAELGGTDLLDADSDLLQDLNNALLAAEDAAYANVFNYADQKIYYHLKDSNHPWINKELWNQLKGMELNGANIYVPHYGVVKETLDKDLKYFEDKYAGTLSMEDYSTFIRNYSTAYLTNAGEQNRIKNLANSLINRSEEDASEEDADDASIVSVAGYADVMKMALQQTDAGEILAVTVNPYADGEASQYSTGNSFIDLCETVSSMLVYVTRKAAAMYAVNDVEADGMVIDIDIVVGSKTVSFENLNGINSSINIFTDQLNEIDMGVVSAADLSDPENPAKLYDFVVPSDFEAYADKNQIIGALIDSSVKQDSSKYLTTKGTAILNDEDASVVTAYHLFEAGDNNQYFYRGSVQMTVKDGNWVAGPLATTAITFYHQTVTNTNRIVYAEEYKWEAEGDGDAVDTYRILGLSGGKTYATGDDAEIVLTGIGLNTVGNTTDNRYYFAVSQSETVSPENMYLPCSTEGKTYEGAGDLYESISAAMDSADNGPQDDAGDNDAYDNDACDNDADDDDTGDNGAGNDDDGLLDAA